MMRSAGALFVLLLVISPMSPAAAEQRFALLIGNQNYNAKVGRLQNPHNDIALIGAALASLNFKVTEVKDADYRTMDTAIKRHAQAVRREGEGAISFLYYSGHGAADPDTKINYLIPVDAANAEDDDLWINSLNLSTVIENLRAQAPQATHYVVFDACRNELNLSQKGKRVLADRGFVPIAAYTPGVMIAYATAPGRTATDIGRKGAPYARALAEEIVKPGIEAMTMFRRVALRVNREIGQDPWISASTLPEIYLGGVPLPEPPPAPPGLPADEIAWSLIKDSSDADLLRRFIEQFPSSEKRDEAEKKAAKLAKLTKPAEPAVKPAPPPPAPAAEPDEMAWNLVKDTKEPDLLRRFVAQFPRSKRLPEAEKRMAELNAAAAVAKTPEQPAPPPKRPPRGNSKCVTFDGRTFCH
jgi:hypothetical protein